MFELVKNNLTNIDIFIACAAVADFKVKNISQQKIKKNLLKNFLLEFELNPDILESIGNNANRPKMVIGFCAESENIIENAQQKLHKKNCDLVIANDIENGRIFGSNETKAYLITRKKQHDSMGSTPKPHRPLARPPKERMRRLDRSKAQRGPRQRPRGRRTGRLRRRRSSRLLG